MQYIVSTVFKFFKVIQICESHTYGMTIYAYFFQLQTESFEMVEKIKSMRL